MNRITVQVPGHKYIIQDLDGTGDQIIQFVSRPPLHPPHPGILIQDLLRIIIDRLRVLDQEKPWEGNAASLRDLRRVLARQEARALIESVDKGKLAYIELFPTGPDGHLNWNLLDR